MLGNCEQMQPPKVSTFLTNSLLFCAALDQERLSEERFPGERLRSGLISYLVAAVLPKFS